MADWLSLHLFYHQMEAHDRLILQVVAPVVAALAGEGWIDRYFFIRYWEGGPQIRLRLSGSRPGWREEAASLVQRRFGDFVEREPSQAQLNPERFYQAVRQFQGESPPAAPTWYPDHSIQEIPYRPELERYGGPDAMPTAEALFRAASDLAIATLPAVASSDGKRIGLALDLMLLSALPWRIPEGRLAAFFRRYGEVIGHLAGNQSDLLGEAERLRAAKGTVLQERLDRLQQGAATWQLPAPYQAWYQAVEAGVATLAQLEGAGRLAQPEAEIPLAYQGEDPAPWRIPAIGIGQIHMLNNRLGVTMRREAILAYLLALQLSDAEVMRG